MAGASSARFSWTTSNSVYLDVGNVLSVKYTDDPRPYMSADPGAVAFCLFFVLRFGRGWLNIISRVRSATKCWGHGKYHWIWRFVDDIGLTDLGVAWDDVQLVGFDGTKTVFLGDDGVFIDDDFENLYDAGVHPGLTHLQLIQYSNDPRNNGRMYAMHRHERLEHFDEVVGKVHVLTNWWQLAQMMHIAIPANLWDMAVKALPPFHPYSNSVIDTIRGQMQLLPRQPPAPPPAAVVTASSSADDEPQAKAKPRRPPASGQLPQAQAKPSQAGLCIMSLG
jgi:hypothetical protein